MSEVNSYQDYSILISNYLVTWNCVFVLYHCGLAFNTGGVKLAIKGLMN